MLVGGGSAVFGVLLVAKLHITFASSQIIPKVLNFAFQRFSCNQMDVLAYDNEQGAPQRLLSHGIGTEQLWSS